jgi:hypothetical protein
MARTVHDISSIVRILAPLRVTRLAIGSLVGAAALMGLAGLGGCLIPPQIEVAIEDARTNSPPAITGVTSDRQALPEPGPVRFEQGRTAGTLTVSLVDTDLGDTLYVRIFVDYNLPNRLDARVRCMAPPSTDATRTTSCILSTLCTDDDIGVQRVMTIMVFDRQLLENGEDPAFQAMLPGGMSTSRVYFLTCQPKPS